jgi:hypothetical protein
MQKQEWPATAQPEQFQRNASDVGPYSALKQDWIRLVGFHAILLANDEKHG